VPLSNFYKQKELNPIKKRFLRQLMNGSVQSLGLKQTITHAKSPQRNGMISGRFIKETGYDSRTPK